jgi:hypothetical protein
VTQEIATIPAPEVRSGVHADLYHAMEAASYSRLKILDDSPAQMRWEIEHPNNTRDRATRSAFHAAVLQPDTFSADYIVSEQCRAMLKTRDERCRNPGKFFVDSRWLCATHGKESDHNPPAGATVLTPGEYDIVTNCAASIFQHSICSKLLMSSPAADRELSIFWEDESSGQTCKARLDCLVRSAGIILDLKTTDDPQPDRFRFQARKLRYDVQAAFYLRGCKACGIAVDKFVIAAVKEKPAHGVTLMEFDEQSLARANAEIDRLLAIYATCSREGRWPNYDETKIMQITIPEKFNGEL